jgi:immune inhibitor A
VQPGSSDLIALARTVQAFRAADATRCAVAPDPQLKARMRSAFRDLDASLEHMLTGRVQPRVEPRRLGLNDGLIVPPTAFAAGTPLRTVARAAAERAPLRGTVRVIVVLVEFPDRPFTQTADHFRDLFFSTGQIPTGSVREYFDEVSSGLITIDGEVVGPYELERPLAEYAHGEAGMSANPPNAQTMARDALVAADGDVNFDPYDNDGNGYVDAFVVVHAGRGGEQTGSTGDIWSHKWTLEGGARSVDATKVFAYLTIPEDARTGVCAHELGHLVFGWPDLYDTDGTSAGAGNFCLMAGGSWNFLDDPNDNGHTPCHPCALLKVDQGWVRSTTQTTDGSVDLQDVKDGREVICLWDGGQPGSEYFLVENRQRNRFDGGLPGDGLLIWHIDESVDDNRDEQHYRVALMQADGRRDLEREANGGDDADPFPGTTANRAFDAQSNPNSNSYTGGPTSVSVREIGPSGPTMSARLGVGG